MGTSDVQFLIATTDDRVFRDNAALLDRATDRTDLQEPGLGFGTSLAVRLFSRDCEGGAVHTITVTATDSQGAVAVAVRVVEIGELC